MKVSFEKSVSPLGKTEEKGGFRFTSKAASELRGETRGKELIGVTSSDGHLFRYGMG